MLFNAFYVCHIPQSGATKHGFGIMRYGIKCWCHAGLRGSGCHFAFVCLLSGSIFYAIFSPNIAPVGVGHR